MNVDTGDEAAAQDINSDDEASMDKDGIISANTGSSRNAC